PNETSHPICAACTQLIASGGVVVEGESSSEPSTTRFRCGGTGGEYDCQEVLDRLAASSKHWRSHMSAVAIANAIRSRHEAVRVRLAGVAPHLCGTLPSYTRPSRERGRRLGRGAGRQGRGRGGRRKETKPSACAPLAAFISTWMLRA
ncbi:MAG: hypothetical protein SGPRY_004781, partial [Prymnesium sp.]